VSLVPDQATFRQLAQTSDLIPVCLDLMADLETPVSVYARLRTLGEAFLFESVTGGEHIGRYSFCGASPALTITSWEDRTEIVRRGGGQETVPTPADPLTLVKREVAGLRVAKVPGLPPFVGGMVGMVGYEYVHRVEPTVPRAAKDPAGAPLTHFMLVDRVVAFDNARQTLRLIVNARVASPAQADEAYAAARRELEALRAVVTGPRAAVAAELPAAAELAQGQANITQAAFEANIRRTQEYIRAGDCVQVVLSRRTDVPFQGDPLDLYRVLRHVNPSPYMFVIETGRGFDVVGASPEVNVRLTERCCEIRPIAGTRPRGVDEAADRRLEAELLADPKERSEHLMLVDLLRNDVGRVSAPGTVRVPEFMAVERYSHVMHLVSQVEGDLAGGATPADVIRALFPGGTITGAPKVRTMQVIAELEPVARAFYTGSFGWIGASGDLCLNIIIRSLWTAEGRAFVQAGAGVVADSQPRREHAESWRKAQAPLLAAARAALP